ncbi:phospho-sugar mutase [Christensenella tenuis]|uniref:Phospho-sugar mutase n=1 Tax=Christensenella tenuis TaxID=2763033 RepID=A0ABR7EEL8_9FIRM|nr:phospho-sugar mutase [Christensenella tenuis]MBC5648196.1 phospho-sugar mutase [Christensenella tenuis]
MNERELYKQWIENATEDKEVAEELIKIKKDDEAVKDRFYRNLAFGTGGLRGVIGAGTNRMNIYTVRKASQGLADYLNEEFKRPSIAIAYDSRKNSRQFARAAAEVFAQNGIKVFQYETLMPTPMLSFAVRHLGCSAGIVVTASHNPAKYNGYKVYGPDGCQITLDAAEKITGYIERKDIFRDIHTGNFDTFLNEGKIRYIGQDTIDAYFDAVRSYSVFEDGGDIRIVYTPLNGTGLKPVLRILNETGFQTITVVPEQEEPDENFTTCPYPNPEEKAALQLGLELCAKTGADLLLGTDPDCDRVGAAVRQDGNYVLINGNQMGVLLFDFVCAMRKKYGTMPENPVAVKTIVTTEMAQSIADQYGVQLKNVLTGFKFIGEQIGLLEENGEADRYVFGFEESYGYLSGTHARDKDAVNAAMLICEMASYYRQQGKTLADRLNELYLEHGYFYDKLESFTFEGADGMLHMAELMKSLRIDSITELGGAKVVKVSDYLASVEKSERETQKIDLPKSDVMGYALAGGSSVVVRPSGTEPKIKVYYSLKCPNEENASKLYAAVSADIHKILGVG